MIESQEVVIERPLPEVFHFLADFENDPQWRTELLDIRRLEGFPRGVGERFTQNMQWEGRSMESTFEVTSVQLDRRIEFGGVAEGAVVAASCVFQSIDQDTTKVTIRAEIATSGALHVLEPFLRALVRRQLECDSDSLQALLNRRGETLNKEGSPAET